VTELAAPLSIIKLTMADSQTRRFSTTAISNKNQSITFCGFGAHHQNGIVENKNKQLTQGSCIL
jgi:hypothetical protein